MTGPSSQSTQNTNLVGLSRADYRGAPSTLCQGCGHNGIAAQIVAACFEMNIVPENLVKLPAAKENRAFLVDMTYTLDVDLPDGKGGITATPCGVCEACTAIDAGRFVDYIEMDAASNRGVEEMVQLLERAMCAASSARFKVYMIDEVHMLTSHAFNAMLKTLEEPPDYVKFILATTDPQKIPVTVLSRCLQFNLKQMTPTAIGGRLTEILGFEAIAAEPAAVQMLARAARGSMRDGLSLLDQAIAYAAGPVTLDAVRAMLGAIDQGTLVRVLDAVAARDAKQALAIADEMGERSLSFAQATRDLASLLHRIALAQQVPDAVPDDEVEAADIRRLAGVFAPDEVQLYYQVALHGRNDMHLAPDEYAGFTMTLLRMLAFAPADAAGRQRDARRTRGEFDQPHGIRRAVRMGCAARHMVGAALWARLEFQNDSPVPGLSRWPRMRPARQSRYRDAL